MEGNGFSSRKSSGVGSGQTELQVAESKESDLAEQDMDVAGETSESHLMQPSPVVTKESKRSNSARRRGDDSQSVNIPEGESSKRSYDRPVGDHRGRTGMSGRVEHVESTGALNGSESDPRILDHSADGRENSGEGQATRRSRRGRRGL